jgi:hypothetical protein
MHVSLPPRRIIDINIAEMGYGGVLRYKDERASLVWLRKTRNSQKNVSLN